MATSRNFLDPRHSPVGRHRNIFSLFFQFFLLRKPLKDFTLPTPLLADPFLCLCLHRPYPFASLIFNALNDRKKRFRTQFASSSCTFSLPAATFYTFFLQLPALPPAPATLPHFSAPLLSLSSPSSSLPSSPSRPPLPPRKKPKPPRARVVADRPPSTSLSASPSSPSLLGLSVPLRSIPFLSSTITAHSPSSRPIPSSLPPASSPPLSPIPSSSPPIFSSVSPFTPLQPSPPLASSVPPPSPRFPSHPPVAFFAPPPAAVPSSPLPLPSDPFATFQPFLRVIDDDYSTALATLEEGYIRLHRCVAHQSDLIFQLRPRLQQAVLDVHRRDVTIADLRARSASQADSSIIIQTLRSQIDSLEAQLVDARAIITTLGDQLVDARAATAAAQAATAAAEATSERHRAEADLLRHEASSVRQWQSQLATFLQPLHPGLSSHTTSSPPASSSVGLPPPPPPPASST